MSRLYTLFSDSLNEWLEPLLLSSSCTKVRESAALLISFLSNANNNENRNKFLHALLELFSKLGEYADDLSYQRRRSRNRLASFCDILIGHIQTKSDLALFEKIALKRDADEKQDVCFLPSLVFRIDNMRRERDDDKLACMRLWIHAMDIAVEKCGESEIEAAKKWDIHGLETIDEENSRYKESPAELFSNHFIALTSDESPTRDTWNSVAVSTFYDLAARLCVVHPEEQSESFLAVFTKHDNFKWALNEIVIKRWFKFENSVDSIFKIVRYCVKYRQDFAAKLMRNYMTEHLKSFNMYSHRVAGALSLTRVLCSERRTNFIHELVKDETAFVDVMLKKLCVDKDNNVKTVTRHVSESFKILNIIRAHVEEGEDDIWKAVRPKMTLILITIVSGIEIASGHLDPTVRDGICDTCVYFFRHIEEEDEVCLFLGECNRVLASATMTSGKRTSRETHVSHTLTHHNDNA